MRPDAVRMAPGIERRIKPCALGAEQRDEALVREPETMTAWFFTFAYAAWFEITTKASEQSGGRRQPSAALPIHPFAHNGFLLR
jgi:hypothetical protein